MLLMFGVGLHFSFDAAEVEVVTVANDPNAIDIAERGLMLTGGGALLRDLDRLESV